MSLHFFFSKANDPLKKKQCLGTTLVPTLYQRLRPQRQVASEVAK